MVNIQRDDNSLKDEFKNVLKNEFVFIFREIGKGYYKNDSFYVEVEVQYLDKVLKAYIVYENYFIIGTMKPVTREVILAQSGYFIDVFNGYKEMFLRKGISKEGLGGIGITYLLRRAIGELAVEKFKETTKYKMHCLYGGGFKDFFMKESDLNDN